jgi:N-acetylneuraminic acid mutarotase
VHEGILDDFYELNLQSMRWTKIQRANQALYPGARRRHAAVVLGEIMYLFGGQVTSIISTNCLHCYDFKQRNWKQANNSFPASIDSHALVVHENRLLTFGGYLA